MANRLELPAVDRAVVVLIDGLGADPLRERAGHARTLASAMATKADIIATGVPTTTAAALATLTTGVGPGTYEWFCTVPGHKLAGMTGTVTVD